MPTAISSGRGPSHGQARRAREAGRDTHQPGLPRSPARRRPVESADPRQHELQGQERATEIYSLVRRMGRPHRSGVRPGSGHTRTRYQQPLRGMVTLRYANCSRSCKEQASLSIGRGRVRTSSSVRSCIGQHAVGDARRQGPAGDRSSRHLCSGAAAYEFFMRARDRRPDGFGIISRQAATDASCRGDPLRHRPPPARQALQKTDDDAP